MLSHETGVSAQNIAFGHHHTYLGIVTNTRWAWSLVLVGVVMCTRCTRWALSRVLVGVVTYLVLLEMRLVVKRLRALGALERLLPCVAPARQKKTWFFIFAVTNKQSCSIGIKRNGAVQIFALLFIFNFFQ